MVLPWTAELLWLVFAKFSHYSNSTVWIAAERNFLEMDQRQEKGFLESRKVASLTATFSPLQSSKGTDSVLWHFTITTRKGRTGCVVVVRKFHQYLYGREFAICTDHKPLLGLLGQQSYVTNGLSQNSALVSPYSYEPTTTSYIIKTVQITVMRML